VVENHSVKEEKERKAYQKKYTKEKEEEGATRTLNLKNFPKWEGILQKIRALRALLYTAHST
jgi:hypothetical protein